MTEDQQQIRFIRLYSIFENSFFKNRDHIIEIPLYQRGYKWAVKRSKDSDSSVEYFVKSLIKSSENNEADFFLQGITVNDEKENNDGKRIIEVVDGQQRITTLYLLLWYLDITSIKHCDLSYENRIDSKQFLNELKAINPCAYDIQQKEDDSQDIFFIKEAIKQIQYIFSDKEESVKHRLVDFIKNKISVIYVPIRKDKIVSTFMMMNGAKAVMRQEELIKAELLRQVSKIMESEVIHLDNLDSAFETLRHYAAQDWMTASLRAKYAREWDKWLQWWNQHDVVKYFMIDRRPMGLLLNYFMRDKSSRRREKVEFREFKNIIPDAVGEIFEELRKLQKTFEDIYNTPIVYNLLGVALRCPGNDRYETIKFFRENLHEISVLKKYSAMRVYGCTHEEATNEVKFKERKGDFVRHVESKFVYGCFNEEAFRLLLWLNIIQDNKLGRKFNFRSWEYRSLEHIHPKSKVFHSEIVDDKVVYKTGADKVVSKNEYDSKPNEVLYRKDIEAISTNNGTKITEHSIGNLVLFFVSNNSEFGNKPFSEKKEILFNMDITNEKEKERMFESRSLIHSMSKFASQNWGPHNMATYYDEICRIIDNGLEND